jgi:hypothetical protein
MGGELISEPLRRKTVTPLSHFLPSFQIYDFIDYF